MNDAAKRYGALGQPADVAEKISEYIKAGARESASTQSRIRRNAPHN